MRLNKHFLEKVWEARIFGNLISFKSHYKFKEMNSVFKFFEAFSLI